MRQRAWWSDTDDTGELIYNCKPCQFLYLKASSPRNPCEVATLPTVVRSLSFCQPFLVQKLCKWGQGLLYSLLHPTGLLISVTFDLPKELMLDILGCHLYLKNWGNFCVVIKFDMFYLCPAIRVLMGIQMFLELFNCHTSIQERYSVFKSENSLVPAILSNSST